MTNLFIIVFVLVILSSIVTAFVDSKPNPKQQRKKRWTRKGLDQSAVAELYQAAGPLLSAAELNFYRVLSEVVQHWNDSNGKPVAVVMSKVRVLDLVDVKKGLDRSSYQSAFNRIRAKHVDFVLVRPADMSVMCVIELDDSTHRQKKVQERDRLMDSIYGAVGLPIVHVACRRKYVKEELAGVIREAMGG